jgi:hypothetical protein
LCGTFGKRRKIVWEVKVVLKGEERGGGGGEKEEEAERGGG